jgi:alkaline phosphatase
MERAKHFSTRKRVAAGVIIGTVLDGAGVRTKPDRDDRSQNLRDAVDSGRARNVIMFLGDGMGDSEITIGRNYQVGANGRLWMDTLPFTGEFMTINYATRPHGQSQDHTGSEVRIAAQGPQAANVVGITNQTDLFHTMARPLGLE